MKSGDSKGSLSDPYSDFYTDLAEYSKFSDGLSIGKARVPGSWFVAMTDVVESTKAVEQGDYKKVNIAGALPIIGLARMYNTLQRPFVFGGDGMTFLIDPAHIDQAKTILSRIIRDIELFFGYQIRAAIVPVQKLLDRGAEIFVSRVRLSPEYAQAFFQGDGIPLAEDIMKHPGPEDGEYFLRKAQDDVEVNYEGFTCRWADVPSATGLTAALIVQPREGTDPGEIWDLIESVLGDSEEYHPLQVEQMRLGGKESTWRIPYLVKNRGRRGPTFVLQSFIGLVEIFVTKLCIRLRIPLRKDIYRVDEAREQNRANTDYRKYEGMLKMIFSARPEVADRLEEELSKLYRDGRVYYGIHRSNGAHMTCLATLEAGDDIHFVDATNGGYSFAAKAMKNQKKLVQSEIPPSRKTETTYGDFASAYEEIFPLGPKTKEFCLSELGLGGSVLDLGCATGELIRELASSTNRAIGIDQDEEFVQVAAKRAQDLKRDCEFRNDDIFREETYREFADSEFDLVTCLGNTLAHGLDTIGVGNLLHQSCRVLKPGGALAVSLLHYRAILADPAFSFPDIRTKSLVFRRAYEPHGTNLEFRFSLGASESDAWESRTLLRPWALAELNSIAIEAGFESFSWYADFDLNPIESDSMVAIGLFRRSK